MSSPARSLLARVRRVDPVLVDRLVAGALLLAIELQIWLQPVAHQRVSAALAGAVASAGVAVRRRHPLEALVAGVAASIVPDALGGSAAINAVGVIPAAILAFYAAGAFLPEGRARLALVLGVAGLGLDVLLTTRAAADLFFSAGIVGLLPWATGRLAHARAARERAGRALAERLDSERELRAATAASGERARVARELHDVIAHSVSVMVIQAGAARVVMDTDPTRAESSLELVERAGREALAEMRRLLGLLDDGGDAPALEPQPRLADVEQLVARACEAGLAAELRVDGDATVVSSALDLCAYRIVQEALTNAIRYAGGARVTVWLRWEREALELEVLDDGRGAAVGGVGASGHGIAGMRERAALHGGRIQAGPRPHGGFAVRASLPLTVEGDR